MSKKKAEKPVEIKLKSILGIPPGLYLLILYSFIVITVLFLVFFLPGIINNGSLVKFSTTPDGAATYCDDVYIGSGEFTTFISKGNHTFRFEKYGYDSESIELKTGGRLLFSWIFPRKESLNVPLNLDSLESYLSNKAKTLYEWSYITDYSSNYFYPELYTELARDLSETDLSANQISRISDFYKLTSALISSEEMLLDYIVGEEILNEIYKTNFSDFDNVEFLKSYFSNDDTLKISSMVEEKASLQIKQYNYAEIIKLLETEFFLFSADNVILGDMAFTTTSPLTEFPYQISLNPFAISTREISVKDFSLFIEQNPYWAKDNSQELLEDGLIDDQYLLDMDIQNPDGLPIRNISWYAAKAYTDWISALLIQENTGVYMSLPSTSQWQYAAKLFKNTYTKVLSSAPAFAKTPVNFLGNVWELCNDTYLPTGSALFLNIDDELDSEWTQRTVMGGSWANSASDINIFTIGSIEPFSCSEFIGFRTVLMFKE
jgi:gamma-glutamyl hercynylcysteine S-oxide synthase